MRVSLHRAVFVLATIGVSSIFLWTWTAVDFVQDETRGRQTADENGEHCVVHVSGLHHSGTGLVHQLLHEALGPNDSSMMRGERVPENEGQHFQDVFPAFRKRNRQYCAGVDGEANGVGNVYYCPAMLEAIDGRAKNELWKQWSMHWDLSKRYLLQKTPTLDILYLEGMKVKPTFHVVVMRHPFAWHWPKRNHEPRQVLGGWLDGWAQLLRGLADGRARSFAIVQYENLVRHPERSALLVADLIESDCLRAERSAYRARKILELRGDSVSQHFIWPARVAATHKACMQDTECASLMHIAEPLLHRLGYDLQQWAAFNREHNGPEILYSHREGIPIEIVKEFSKISYQVKEMGW